MNGMNVLVTGGGSGIGLETAKLFATRGDRVAVIDKSFERAEEAVGSLEGSGHLALAADVSSDPEMLAAFSKLKARFESLHAVVANAGINGVWAPLTELTAEEWDQTMAVNLRSTFLTLKYAVPLLPRGGSVVVVSSINGNRIFNNTGASAYAASKAAQVALSKMAAVELATMGIRVNCICPGTVKSNISESTFTRGLEELRAKTGSPSGDIPLTDGLPAHGKDVAEAVLFLCSDGARHITGTELYVDGGQSLHGG